MERGAGDLVRVAGNAGESGENMAVSQELLDILVCPLDKTPVKLTPDGQGLKCSQCHRVYPIKDDIPVMLIDEASVARTCFVGPRPLGATGERNRRT